nr:hypothetical protein [Tanacetum cinerariifolium]
VKDVTRLQALVDKKKVVITDLQLESLAMASAVICLSTGQEIEEEGDEDEHIEDVTAGDDAQGDDTAAHGKRVDTSNDNVMGDESNQGMMINEMDKDDVVILMDEKRRIRRLKRLRLMRMLRKVGAAPSRRRKGVVIRDPKEESTTSLIISTETKSKDKGKGIMVE